MSFEGMSDDEIRREVERMRQEKGFAKMEAAKTEGIDATLARLEKDWAGLEPPSEADLRARFKQAEMEALQQRAIARWREANVPPRHAKRVHHVTTGRAGAHWLEKLRLLRTMKPDALVALVGPHGTGKTQLAVEIIREFTTRGQHALWTTATEFFMEVKTCYRQDSKGTEKEIVWRFSRFDLLVIDEIHRRKDSDWENELLFLVIDRMYQREKMVIVISNESAEQFEASMGPALVSRMQETGGIIACDWPSFRE